MLLFDTRMPIGLRVCGLHQGRTLAYAGAEVVEFRATHFAAAGDFDLSDTWCVNGENTLHAFAVGNFANGERRIDAVAFATDDQTGEDLNALFATFHNAAMHFDGISYVEVGDVRFQLLVFDFSDDVHGRK